METTGKLTGASRTFDGRGIILTFEVDASAASQIENLQNQDKLKIKAVRYTQKRSLDANAYFHVLVGKIADVLTISKAKAKNVLICKYGQPEYLPDGNIFYYQSNAPEEYMWEQETIHAMPVRYDGKLTVYKIYRGSHTYDTKEMSVLIDGTVADAKELGIDTITPAELQEMKERWGIRSDYGAYSRMIWNIAILPARRRLSVIIFSQAIRTGRIVRSMDLSYRFARICIRMERRRGRMPLEWI